MDIPREAAASRGVLATDLDGTFIPLDDVPQNQTDLECLSRMLGDQQVQLVFVTGRHRASVLQVMDQHGLPQPEWMVCDVGTTIYRRGAAGRYEPLAAYRDHLDAVVRSLPVEGLQPHLLRIEGLRRQETEKQGRFKLSFYCDAAGIDALVQQLTDQLNRLDAPYTIIASVDPFTGDGLIDLLPRQVSKAYALKWWSEYLELDAAEIVFAGDSGNDLAAFQAGYRVIVVANAERSICHTVLREHRRQGWQQRLFFAREPATSGVLEGCRWFELLPPDDAASAAASRPQTGLGARPVSVEATRFRVWAPRRTSVEVELPGTGDPQRIPLHREPDGYFSGLVRGVGPGARYRYRLDHSISRPDPATRYQPEGVHGWSQVIDPYAYPWGDADWQGCEKDRLVIYELHIGSFTSEGTYTAALQRLGELRQLGITAIELMPIAQSAGRWNWGYDGVNLFAPRDTYGPPDQLMAFVDACHAMGLAVILDVVYNHLGPEGNYLADFGPYFSDRHTTPWGPALNFDGPDAAAVRDHIVANAVHWIDDYHFDGLRVDAIHFMLDASEPSIVTQMRAAVRERQSQLGRRVLLIAETNVHDPQMLAPAAAGGHGFDAIWCDDFLHGMFAVVSPGEDLTHRRYRGASDLALTLQRGFVFEGFPHERSDASPDSGRADLASLVFGIQNHDFIGNHPLGRRLHLITSAAVQRTAAAMFLLYPAIPILFMGEEFASSAPFNFFVDYGDPSLRQAVVQGRIRDFPQHDWDSGLLPISQEAFFQSQIGEIHAGDAGMHAWYGALIRLRRQWQSEGWLRAEGLQVTHDADWNLYALRYTRSDGRSVSLLARLGSAADETGAVPLPVTLEDRVLLNSADEPFAGGAAAAVADGYRFPLQMNQAIAVAGNCRWDGLR